jgi:hypothetical protein
VIPREPVARRWLWRNAILGAAVANLVINAVIAWVSAHGHDAVPVWPTELIGDPSTVTDTLGTLFLLPLITCLVVTPTVRREVAAGHLGRRTDLRLPLPRNTLLRGLALGAACLAALALPGLGLAALLGELGVAAFVTYKVVLAIALGAVVTPLIALAAMND